MVTFLVIITAFQHYVCLSALCSSLKFYSYSQCATDLGTNESYCSLKPLCSDMREVVPARTSPTLPPPSPRTRKWEKLLVLPGYNLVAFSRNLTIDKFHNLVKNNIQEYLEGWLVIGLRM